MDDKKEIEELENELKRLDEIERRRSLSYKPNGYKSIYLGTLLWLGIASFAILMYLAGKKSGADKCKR